MEIPGGIVPLNILVVEPDISAAGPLLANIKRWNHTVETSTTGKSALAKLRQKKFDLVLLNLFLPDVKGSELIPQIKEMLPKIGIVTLTDQNSRELESEVRLHGILYYMIKPVRPKILKEILDHLSKKNAKEMSKNERTTRGN